MFSRTSIFVPRFSGVVCRMSSQLGDMGSGAGKGGGGGGSIREAGGAFGKMEAAREEEYFYKKSREQLEKLREGKANVEEYYQKKIEDHREAIKRYQTRLDDINNINSNYY